MKWLRQLFAANPVEISAREQELSPNTDVRLPYRAYTTANDRIISSDEIDDAIAEYPDNRFPTPEFRTFFELVTKRCEVAADRVNTFLRSRDNDDVAVTLLIDHSGSGGRFGDLCLAPAASGVISNCLTAANVRHEILGFTTRSWHGGTSRAAWLRTGDPFPGRLCDLLHIVHRPFDMRAPLSFEAMERMTHAGLHKENVDGEALLWAAARLRESGGARKVMIVLSDGAPVDDATLMTNSERILTDHLREVTSSMIRAGDIELYAISPNEEHWLTWYYPQHLVVSDIDGLAELLLPFLAAVIASPSSAPRDDQL
jgi:cobaltochelatase CobT